MRPLPSAVPPLRSRPKPERTRDVIALLLLIALALALRWDARDLIWSAWLAGVVATTAMLAAMVVKECYAPSPGFPPLSLSEVLPGLALLLAIFLVPLLPVSHLLRPLHPEPEAVAGAGFLRYIWISLRVAAGDYWPFALVLGVQHAWDVLVTPRAPDQKSERLGLVLAELVRLAALGLALSVLHAFALPRAMVVLALVVPPETVKRLLDRSTQS
jgi:hypothetical protein